jgi:hypothetical protein
MLVTGNYGYQNPHCTYICFMSVTLPDLMNPDPSRSGINEETIAGLDIPETVIEFHKNLSRFEDSLMSRYATSAINDLDELIRRAQYMRKRLINERMLLNKAFRPRG